MLDLRPRRYRLIAFDWDGTLADSTAIIAASIQAACRDVGEPVPDDVAARYVIGLGLAEALAHVRQLDTRRPWTPGAIALPQPHGIRARVAGGIDDDVFGFRHVAL